MKNIKIERRSIGKDEPCFIIAEVGSNHDGKLSQAKELIDIAAQSGADAVKFQAYQTDRMVAKTREDIEDGKLGGPKKFYELYKKTELPREWLRQLTNYARMKNIIFLCSPFDEEAVDELDALHISAFKIASVELSHLPLLEYTARRGKPLILSTAMASLGDIEQAINAILEQNNDQIVLLHCAMGYPLKPKSTNLAVMETLRQAFPYPVGYSDHTLGIGIPIAAVARGAKSIEKHFTISRDLPGPDHPFALEPDELKAMVREIRAVEKAIGSPQKKVLNSELIYYQRGKRSIFAKADILEGTIIKREMLIILHPGLGIEPKYLDTVIGRKAQIDIKAQEAITWKKI